MPTAPVPSASPLVGWLTVPSDVRRAQARATAAPVQTRRISTIGAPTPAPGSWPQQTLTRHSYAFLRGDTAFACNNWDVARRQWEQKYSAAQDYNNLPLIAENEAFGARQRANVLMHQASLEERARPSMWASAATRDLLERGLALDGTHAPLLILRAVSHELFCNVMQSTSLLEAAFLAGAKLNLAPATHVTPQQRRAEQWERIAQWWPELTAARLCTALVYGRQGDTDKSLSLLRGLTQEAPQCMQAHELLGRTLRDLGRWSEAKDTFRHLVRTWPEEMFGWHNLCVTFVALDDERGAQQVFGSCIYNFSEPDVRAYRLGNDFALQHGPKMRSWALRCYEHARKVTNDTEMLTNAWLRQATALAADGEIGGALAAFDKAFEHIEAPAVSHLLYREQQAHLLAQSNRLDEALAIFAELTLDPYCGPQILDDAAQVAFRLGHYAEAAALWARAFALDPEDFDCACMHALALMHVNVDAAVDYAEQLAARLPQNSQVLQVLGEAQRRTGQRAAALTSLKRAIELGSTGQGPSYASWIALHNDAGEYAQALGVAQSALEAASQDALVHYQRGRTALLQHDYASALAALERAVELEPFCVPALGALLELSRRGFGSRKRIDLMFALMRLAPHDPKLELELGWDALATGDEPGVAEACCAAAGDATLQPALDELRAAVARTFSSPGASLRAMPHVDLVSRVEDVELVDTFADRKNHG